MVTNYTSSSGLTTLVKAYYDKVMLERLVPNLMWQQFGVKKALPKHEGNSVIWHRWQLLGKGRLITESGAGVGTPISAARISASLLMVGHHAIITTYVDMVSINSVVEGAIELFADSAALTLDFITARRLLWRKVTTSAQYSAQSVSGTLGSVSMSGSIVAGSTNNGYCCSSTVYQAPVWSIENLASRNVTLSSINGGDSATLYTPKIIRSVRLKLRVKNALPFEDGYYKAIIHPDLVNQLRGSSAFIDLHKYTEPGAKSFQEGMLRGGESERGVVGILEGIKFYETTEVPIATWAGAKMSAAGYGRIYFTFFFGKGAYGVTEFDGGIRTFVKTPGPQSTSNPLDLYSTVGYRIISAQQVLNPSACLWIASGRPVEYG